jgi:hypothetical protein
MLVSFGTGKAMPHTKFGGLLTLAKYARKAITDTEKAHATTREFATLAGADYFRFDVRPIENIHGGLSHIKLDECKKKRRKGMPTATTPLLDAEEEEPHAADPDAILDLMDAQNAELASQPNRKGGYKPHKYEYTTFDAIKRLTDEYCASRPYSISAEEDASDAGQNVSAEIDRCARILVEYSRRRRAADPVRWSKFRKHPDPGHESNGDGSEA